MSLLAEKIEYIRVLMDEWKLSVEEKAKILPESPTEEDCDNIYNLECNLRLVRLSQNGVDLSEEEHLDFRVNWLRTSLPPLQNLSPLDFVSGKSENLLELIERIERPYRVAILQPE